MDEQYLLTNQELLNLYQPILYLHTDEKVSPISFDDYIKDCELYNDNELLL